MAETPGDPRSLVHDVLASVRSHLGMEVAFISQFVGSNRVFRALDGAYFDCGMVEGEGGPLDESLCARVVAGEVAGLLPDAQEVSEARLVPAIVELGIGAHLSVPILLSDGSVYGTFCCFSRRPDHSLGERDLAMMRAFAQVLSREIERHGDVWRLAEVLADRIASMVESDEIPIDLQPIVRLSDATIVGAEALAHFPDDAPTLDWFRAAHWLGLGVALEAGAVRSAARALRTLQADVYLAFNLSTPALLGVQLDDLIADLPPERLVLELTEHERVRDYDQLKRTLAPMRHRGVRLSVDDAGAGYATLTHVLELQPDIVKLDLAITRGISGDPARQAVAAAIVEFGRVADCEVIAEGIETADDLKAVRALGIRFGQGYQLGRPVPPGVGWRVLPGDP